MKRESYYGPREIAMTLSSGEVIFNENYWANSEIEKQEAELAEIKAGLKKLDTLAEILDDLEKTEETGDTEVKQ